VHQVGYLTEKKESNKESFSCYMFTNINRNRSYVGTLNMCGGSSCLHRASTIFKNYLFPTMTHTIKITKC
jgi:hypothetical protein